jgi:hypothetical protein
LLYVVRGLKEKVAASLMKRRQLQTGFELAVVLDWLSERVRA